VQRTNDSEGTMRDMIVVGFEGIHRATEVLNQVLALNADWTVDLRLDDALAVYRTADGRLRVDQGMQPTSRQAAASGGVLGAFLGALLAVPFTGGASGVAAAAAIGAGALTGGGAGALIGDADATALRETYGISEAFVQQVGGMVQPGQSAVFLLAESDEPGKIAKSFRGYGGTILRTTLRPEQAKQIQQVIGADRPITR
jgi:uncharacterized membrane protein